MPNQTEIAAQTFKPTGETLLTPPIGDTIEDGYKLVLEGVFRFSHNDMAFDPVQLGLWEPPPERLGGFRALPMPGADVR